jgi:hypothetical protein
MFTRDMALAPESNLGGRVLLPSWGFDYVLAHVHAWLLAAPPPSQWLQLALPALGLWWLALAIVYATDYLRAPVVGLVISALSGIDIRVQVCRQALALLLHEQSSTNTQPTCLLSKDVHEHGGKWAFEHVSRIPPSPFYSRAEVATYGRGASYF